MACMPKTLWIVVAVQTKAQVFFLRCHYHSACVVLLHMHNYTNKMKIDMLTLRALCLSWTFCAARTASSTNTSYSHVVNMLWMLFNLHTLCVVFYSLVQHVLCAVLLIDLTFEVLLFLDTWHFGVWQCKICSASDLLKHWQQTELTAVHSNFHLYAAKNLW